MNLRDLSFDAQWTLFLDRDGVINHRIVGGYVKHWNEFHFLEGTLEAIKVLSGIFGKTFVVSNQQGIGKGLMNLEHVEDIHRRMLAEIEQNGGKVDQVFFSPHLQEANHLDRKPNIGMALKAQELFPQINFKKSVMVGDSTSDMEFGRNAGMVNVFIQPREDQGEIDDKWYDFKYASLSDFAQSLVHQ